jgi:hypothetical protein
VKNPFKYGGPVTGDAFVDREEELKQLEQDMASAEKVFLIAPRRYGKTSLLLALAGRLRKRGFVVAVVDLYRAADVGEFLSLLSSAVLNAAESRSERALRLARDLLPQLRPRVEIGSDGAPSLTVDISSRSRDLLAEAEDVLDMPEKLAQKAGRPFALILDEFQELARFDGDTWEKKIRAVIQHHENTGYVFSGSKEHTLRAMIEDGTRAFYGMGRAQFLQLLPRKEFARFVTHGFEMSAIHVTKDVVDGMISSCDEYPYNVQQLCHVLWNRCRDKGTVVISDVDDALSFILDGNTPLYAALWESLPGHQRAVLKAVAMEGGRGIYSTGTRDKYRLGAPSTVDTSLKSLCARKSILRRGEDGGYRFYDVFFREWIKRLVRGVV